MTKKRIDIITLGCSKNLVDTEKLLKQFTTLGYKAYHNSNNVKGEIVIINTCGFIGDAKEESIEMILEFTQAKSEGKIKKLYVMGCLSERYMSELQLEIPEVDGYFGKFQWDKILETLGEEYNTTITHKREITTPPHYAYLKISEGCNHACAYCAIPIMTGKLKSVEESQLVKEAEYLIKKGVTEIQLIAQDLTLYGVDIHKERTLHTLVEKLAKVEGLKWLRLHYAYPSHFPFQLLPVIANNSNICKYFDIALQHINDNVLSRMRRNVTKQETLNLIERLRTEVPGIHLRTTLMVGFPGETEEEFEELLQFVKDIRFERLGAFAYSHEEGTYAEKHYKDDIPQEVKEYRLNKIMEAQEQISFEIAAEKVGKQFTVIIDSQEGDYYIGRTQYDSPEVDPEVIVTSSTPLTIGEYYNVEITSSESYDLYGEIVS